MRKSVAGKRPVQLVQQAVEAGSGDAGLKSVEAGSGIRSLRQTVSDGDWSGIAGLRLPSQVTTQA
jgi:hypothetical protein